MRYTTLSRIIFLVVIVFAMNSSYGQLNPLSVGTIHPGDSIVIYYDVTINNPCNCTQISNQGTVSGSNFTTLNTNDPDTGPAGDPTITLLNMFPLPVTLLEFGGNQADGKVNLHWKANEINVSHYDIEKSNTGAAFTKIGTVQAFGNGERSYPFIDQNVSGQVNYYRLKIVDVDGKISYSSILRFGGNAAGKSVLVYPNPITNSQMTIRLSNLSAGKYVIAFYNSIGQETFTKSITHTGGSTIMNLHLPVGIGTGLFTILVKGEGSVYGQKVFIER